MLGDVWVLPPMVDYTATFLFAMAGAWLAIKRAYDIVGICTIAFVSSVGGGIIRDGIFLQQGPPAVTTDGMYIVIVLVGALTAIALQRQHKIAQGLIEWVDALALGAYAVVGMEKSLLAGMAWPAVILVGLINAVGGGVLRDILMRQKPWIFGPAHYYVATVFAGCLMFYGITQFTPLGFAVGCSMAIATTFVLRMLTLHFNWKSTALAVDDSMYDI